MVHRSPLAQMEEERREHVMKMKKMEAEMEQVFEMKVKEKKQKLRDSEAEVGLKEKKIFEINLIYVCFFSSDQHAAITICNTCRSKIKTQM